MKYVSALISSIFFSLFSNAQPTKADISITSITIVGYYTANSPGPATIIPPQGTTPQTVVPAEGRKITVPGREQAPPPYYKCLITVQNGNADQEAFETIVTAMLPCAVNAQTVTPNGIVHRSSDTNPNPGYIEYKLGKLAPGETKTVEFAFTRPFYNYPTKVTVFVVSSSSDPNTTNNYKEASYAQ